MERDRRIEGLVPYARKIAKGLYSAMGLVRCIEEDDFVSEAFVAVVIAVDRYDESRGIPLAGYARAIIVGHLIHVARDSDPQGRYNRRTLIVADEFAASFVIEHGREPSQNEIEEAVPGYMASRARVMQRTPVRLDEPALLNGHGSVTHHDIIADSAPPVADVVASQVDVWANVSRLTALHRRLIELRHRDRLSHKAIGAMMNRSKSWADINVRAAERELRILMRAAS